MPAGVPVIGKCPGQEWDSVRLARSSGECRFALLAAGQRTRNSRSVLSRAPSGSSSWRPGSGFRSPSTSAFLAESGARRGGLRPARLVVSGCPYCRSRHQPGMRPPHRHVTRRSQPGDTSRLPSQPWEQAARYSTVGHIVTFASASSWSGWPTGRLGVDASFQILSDRTERGKSRGALAGPTRRATMPRAHWSRRPEWPRDGPEGAR